MSTSRTGLLRSNRYLLLVVIFVLIMGKSASGQSTIPQPYINLATEGLVYNTYFQIKSYAVSGVLAVKKENDGYHVVLISKLGPTIIDFIITEREIIWGKVVPILDNSFLLDAIERDFRVLLLDPLNHPKKIKALRSHQFRIWNDISLKVKTSDDDKRIIKAKTKRFVNFFKALVTYSYNNDEGIPDRICLRHRNIKLKIELTQLEL